MGVTVSIYRGRFTLAGSGPDFIQASLGVVPWAMFFIGTWIIDP